MENDFNSRPSARGDKASAEADAFPLNFNSRPSARGDLVDVLLYHADVISIHAPPRGATKGE